MATGVVQAQMKWGKSSGHNEPKKMRAYPVLLLLGACPYSISRRSLKNLMATCVAQAHLASGRRQPTLERRRLVAKKDACTFISICFLILLEGSLGNALLMLQAHTCSMAVIGYVYISMYFVLCVSRGTSSIVVRMAERQSAVDLQMS